MKCQIEMAGRLKRMTMLDAIRHKRKQWFLMLMQETDIVVN